jgi:hypothetical protein
MFDESRVRRWQGIAVVGVIAVGALIVSARPSHRLLVVLVSVTLLLWLELGVRRHRKAYHRLRAQLRAARTADERLAILEEDRVEPLKPRLLFDVGPVMCSMIVVGSLATAMVLASMLVDLLTR